MSSPPNFDRLARIYRWMEFASFGAYLWHCRTAFLSSLDQRRNALVLGDGDGRFTAHLLRTNPGVHIDAVDASPAMLEALRRRAGSDTSRVHTWCADARSFHPPNPDYDVIVTHFFLDCLTTGEIQSLAENIRRTAAPRALWLVSEFAIPSGWFGTMIAKPIVSFLYFAFGLLTGLSLRNLPDHHSALRNAGFVLLKQLHWLGGLLVSELWAAQTHEIDTAKQNLRPRRYPFKMGSPATIKVGFPVAFQINASDNVATLLESTAAGQITLRSTSGEQQLTAREPIKAGHKIAIAPIAAGADVVKFGVVIGAASRAIESGEWVHLHNCHSRLDERSNAFDVRTGVPEDVHYE